MSKAEGAAASVPAMNNKMFAYVNTTLHVTLGDARRMVGTLIAYDRHMNLVLSGVVESRDTPKAEGGVATRELGLVMIRGEHVVSIRSEPKQPKVAAKVPAGPGKAVQLPGKKKAAIE
jgi:small nuclear ribonucleoprotein B and B'